MKNISFHIDDLVFVFQNFTPKTLYPFILFGWEGTATSHPQVNMSSSGVKLLSYG